MDIGMACLIGHFVDTVSGLNGGGAEEMPEGMGRNRIRIVIADAIDLSTAQLTAPMADEQIWPAGIGKLLQILFHRIDHFVPDEHDSRLATFSIADGDLSGG